MWGMRYSYLVFQGRTMLESRIPIHRTGNFEFKNLGLWPTKTSRGELAFLSGDSANAEATFALPVVG